MKILELRTGSRYSKRIEIRFLDDNKPFGTNNLYVGFSKNDENYAFEVKTKIAHPANCTYEYVATFLGYHCPLEEDILSAQFDWITDQNIIRQAHKEAGYT